MSGEYEYNVEGKYMTVSEMLADPRCVVSYGTLRSRLVRGTDPLRAMTQKRLRRTLTIEGETMTQLEASKRYGVSLKQISGRINRDGVPDNEAVIPGDRRDNLITAWGETKNIKDWFLDPRCSVNNYATLRYRFVRLKMTPEEALTEPDNLCATYIQAWGERKTIRAWSKDKRCVVDHGTLFNRIVRMGMPPEAAITTEDRLHCTYVEAWGERKTITDWVQDSRCKVNYNTLFQRLRFCPLLTPEDAMTITTYLRVDSSYLHSIAMRKWFLATLNIAQIANLISDQE